MTRRPWTDAERAVVRARYADTPTVRLAAELGRPLKSVYTLADRLGLAKSREYMRERHGTHAVTAGVATRFQPGIVPWNKGVSYQPGGRVRETQFKPGNRPHGWVPIGSYRINGDGYLDRKVADDGRGPRDWVAVHRLVWIEAHGPVPADHVVVFKPGRRTTELAAITLDAVECITRRELLNRNRMPPELQKLVQLRGALTRQINKRTKA
jgi:hypothetical protein